MRIILKIGRLSHTLRNCALHCGRDERGSSLIECAIVLPVLTLLLAGAVDFGRGWYISLQTSAAAEAGALYGIQNVVDISGMKAAALLDASDVDSFQVTATYGSECSDGTSAVPFSTSTPVCPLNVVTYVEVDTTGSYKPILRYPGFSPVINVSGKARMRTSN